MAKKPPLKVIILIAAAIVIFLPPFARYQELRAKNRRLDEKMAALKKESQALVVEKAKLETDITYVEKKAREKIGVVRKGEIVVREVPKK